MAGVIGTHDKMVREYVEGVTWDSSPKRGPQGPPSRKARLTDASKRKIAKKG
jgi:hypothetical protein